MFSSHSVLCTTGRSTASQKHRRKTETKNLLTQALPHLLGGGGRTAGNRSGESKRDWARAQGKKASIDVSPGVINTGVFNYRRHLGKRARQRGGNEHSTPRLHQRKVTGAPGGEGFRWPDGSSASRTSGVCTSYVAPASPTIELRMESPALTQVCSSMNRRPRFDKKGQLT